MEKVLTIQKYRNESMSSLHRVRAFSPVDVYKLGPNMGLFLMFTMMTSEGMGNWKKNQRGK